MPRPVHIIGLGADGLAGLTPASREAIASADFIAGGRRHLALVGATGTETLAITANLRELGDRLDRRREDERCVVLASGDPLFFGIGRYLLDRLGRDAVRIAPAISSMALAFARVGLSWDDATIASVHGRDLETTLTPLLDRPRIGLFTRDGDSPSEISRFFLDRGAADYRAWICEDLGSRDERITEEPRLSPLAGSFSDLNIVILDRLPHSGSRVPPAPGIPDAMFEAPDSGPVLLTHADVRAVTLSRFRDLPDGPIWDVGAGLGGMAVELARAFPERRVVAVERSPDVLVYLRRNLPRLRAFNVRVIAGLAPEALAEEAAPAAVFLGGSGGRLDAILEAVLDRLVPGGTLAANFVGLENFARTLQRLRDAGWQPEATQIQVSHARPLASLTTFVPLRPVWIVRAVKPGP